MSDINELVQACEMGDLDSVKALVEGHDKDALIGWLSKEGTDSHGYSRTPLQMAVKNEHLSIVKYLVNTYPFLIKSTNHSHYNILHFAALYLKKNVDLLQFLIDNYNRKDIKNIINQKNNYGDTPLDCAYKYNKSSIKNDIIKLLRQYGGKANFYDEYGNDLGKGKGDLIDLLAEARSADLLLEAYKIVFPNSIPLVCACEKGRLEDVRVLVEGHDVEKTGMSVEEMVSKEGTDSHGYSRTPLQAAIIYQHLSIVQYLVKTYPFQIQNIDKYGKSSLHFAAMYSNKNVDLLQCLIDNYNEKDIKNIINEKDKDGYTPLDFAYKYNKSSIKNDIIKLLRQYGGKANFYDEYGVKVEKGKGDLNWSEIVVACQKGPLDSVQNLVKGHNVEKTGMSLEVWLSEKGMDSVGDQLTPLQAAVSGKKQEIVEYLLNICPNLISEKIEGKNILQLAVMSKNIVTLKFLLDKTTGNQTIENMIKNMINEKYHKQTPLDIAYQLLKNPDIKNEESKTKTINEIVNLLIKHGATANIYDENGNLKGKGYLYDNIKIKF